MAQPLNDYTNTRGNMLDRGEEELGGLWGACRPWGKWKDREKAEEGTAVVVIGTMGWVWSA